jgi:hypothetical protein
LERTLKGGISLLLDELQASRSDRRKVAAALRTLETILGPLDFRQVAGERQIAQKVLVPGDPATWVVIGTWGDGSYDIVREEGSFSQDVLVGWRPGQSLADYASEIHNISDEQPNAPRGRKVPLLRSTRAPEGT